MDYGIFVVWKGAAHWAKGRGLSDASLFPNLVSKAGSRHLSTVYPVLLIRQSHIKLYYQDGLRNHEWVSQDHSKPFLQLILLGIEPGTSISQVGGNGQILSQNDPMQAVCSVWICQQLMFVGPCLINIWGETLIHTGMSCLLLALACIWKTKQLRARNVASIHYSINTSPNNEKHRPFDHKRKTGNYYSQNWKCNTKNA